MIPRHRPPFGVLALLKHKLLSLRKQNVCRLELDCAELLDVPHAVWLPSARYGICATIQHTLNEQADVFCPVFTCRVVHEAIRQSGRSLRLVDSRPDSFLLNVRAATGGENNFGVVLSEVFGHRFGNGVRQAGTAPLIDNARVRIFDMAMAIPDRIDLQRLRNQDVAVVSFGLGKSLYSGWGGMAFTRDRSLAAVLRQSRERDLIAADPLRSLVQEADIVLRTVAHYSVVYGSLRKLQDRRQPPRPTAGDARSTAIADAPRCNASREWWHGPSRLTTQLTAANFRSAAACENQRRRLADVYRSELSRLDGCGLTLPPQETRGLSHFSVCASAADRDRLRQHLWSAGIDTAALFPFPAECRAADFPHAAHWSRGILNLPLSHSLTVQQVQRVCASIRAFRFSAAARRAA